MNFINNYTSDVLPRGTASPEAASRHIFCCLGLGLEP